MLQLLAELKPREKEILMLRFGFGQDGDAWTLERIGKEQQITRERVRQIEEKALKKLRNLVQQKEQYQILLTHMQVKNEQ